ncbi:hypothetical protein DS742_17400 [Lacrimispora amygdalina]|uniref:Uncharacterized protein n=1 Tax=Lacrimispora amygdalina TaxID=253257 RepID=A0A3E2N9M5_9FIRM|nr:hypothetical protein [Clostridium indicum]RFZ77591.1 hypothetical protein DS742_17400 [Clostridium indicum]
MTLGNLYIAAAILASKKNRNPKEEALLQQCMLHFEDVTRMRILHHNYVVSKESFLKVSGLNEAPASYLSSSPFSDFHDLCIKSLYAYTDGVSEILAYEIEGILEFLQESGAELG